MKFLNLITLCLALTGLQAKADPIANHGMFLLGKKNTYVSHLPMFHAPHDYQVILKVSLKPLDSTTLPAYKKLQEQGETFFTLLPEPFDLSLIEKGNLTTFKADLYQGHFEQNGKVLGTVQVQIEKQIFFKKLAPSTPAASNYLIFGEQGEYFAAHLIETKPSHDTLLSVSGPVSLSFPHCRSMNCGEATSVPISDGNLPLTIPSFLSDDPKEGSVLGGLQEPTVHVLKVLYHEENDLSQ